MHPFIETVRFFYTKDILSISDDFIHLFWEGISKHEYGSTGFFCPGGDEDLIFVRSEIKVRYPLNNTISKMYLQALASKISYCNVDLYYIQPCTIVLECKLNSDDIENFDSWSDSHQYVDNVLSSMISLLQTACLTIHVTQRTKNPTNSDVCDKFLSSRLADLSLCGFVANYTAH